MSTYHPANTFIDLPTLLKKGLASLLVIIGRWWFTHISKHPPRSTQMALAAWLQEDPPSFGWQSSKDIARQETQKMRALTTQNLHEYGESTDKMPTFVMQERAARRHQQRLQRVATVPIPHVPTKAFLDAYNKEARSGLPCEQRTTAAIRRISSPLLLPDTHQLPTVMSPMRKRAIEHRHATVQQHVIIPGWPRPRNTLRSIRLVKDDS